MPLIEVHLSIPDAVIVGGLPCGPALAPFDHPDELLADFIADHPASARFYRVEGESMMGLGIIEGDVVAIDGKLEAWNEDVVMIETEGEYTLKRYEPYATPPGLYGYSHDDKRTHIELDEAVVIGVMTSLIRRYRSRYRVVFTHNM